MQVTQLDISFWDEVGAPFPICTLPIGPADMADRWGLQFAEFDDDGLGLCKAAIVRINEVICQLQSHPQGPPEARLVTVFVRSFEPDSEKALRGVVAALGVPRDSLLWENEPLGPAGWALVRIDDNGNEIEMRRFLLEVSAEAARRAFEKKGHKQLYLVKHLK